MVTRPTSPNLELIRKAGTSSQHPTPPRPLGDLAPPSLPTLPPPEPAPSRPPAGALQALPASHSQTYLGGWAGPPPAQPIGRGSPPRGAHRAGFKRQTGGGSASALPPLCLLLCSPPAAASTMLSVRRPLAPLAPLTPLADPQQLKLSPLKGLSLADKENTVSRTRGPGRAGPGGGGAGAAPHRASPRSPRASVAPACWPARPRGGSSRSRQSR